MKPVLTLLIGLLFLSCGDNSKPKKPENLISQSKMINVLTDAYLSNAARSISSKDIRTKGIELDSIIFKKYQIDSVQFIESHAYYAADLNTYATIFKGVEQNLEAYKKQSDSLNVIEKRLRPGPDLDSIDDQPRLVDPVIDDDSQEEIE